MFSGLSEAFRGFPRLSRAFPVFPGFSRTSGPRWETSFCRVFFLRACAQKWKRPPSGPEAAPVRPRSGPRQEAAPVGESSFGQVVGVCAGTIVFDESPANATLPVEVGSPATACSWDHHTKSSQSVSPSRDVSMIISTVFPPDMVNLNFANYRLHTISMFLAGSVNTWTPSSFL